MYNFYRDLKNYKTKDIYTLANYYGFTGSYESLLWQIAEKHGIMKANMLSVNTQYLFFGKKKDNIPLEKFKPLPVQQPHVFYENKYLELNVNKVRPITVKKTFSLKDVKTVRDKTKEINDKIKNGDLQIIQKIIYKKLTVPTNFYTEEKTWVALAIDIDKDVVYGTYEGEVDLENKVNISSFINISPSYQGKGLCKSFAKFTYKSVVDEYNLTKLYIYIAPKREKIPGACRCYYKAAVENGYKVFITPYLEDIELLDPTGCNSLDNTTAMTIVV